MNWAAGHFRVRGLYCKLQNKFFHIGKKKKTYSTDLVSKIFSYHISTVFLTDSEIIPIHTERLQIFDAPRKILAGRAVVRNHSARSN